MSANRIASAGFDVNRDWRMLLAAAATRIGVAVTVGIVACDERFRAERGEF